MSDQTPDSNIDYGHTLNVTRTHSAVSREKGQHVLSDAPLSLWALLPISCVLIAGGAILGDNMVSTPNREGYNASTAKYLPPDVVSGGADVDPYDPKIWIGNGKKVYGANCAVCHQVSGEGLPGQFPPLKGSEYVIHGEKRPAAILIHGLVGPVTVSGKAFNGAMPAQGSLKTPKELGQVLSYIRNEWGNQGSIVYDDQIAALKEELSARTTSFTAAELDAIPVDENLPPSTKAPAAAPAAAPAPAAK